MNKQVKQAVAALASIAATGSAFAADPTTLAGAVTAADLSDAKTAAYIGIGAVLSVVVIFFGGRKILGLFGR